jgi:hypothetical protein
MTPATLPSTAKAPVRANNPAGDGWTFRAPRHGDLVACPYCANRLTRCCDFCGDEGVLFAIDLENMQ